MKEGVRRVVIAAACFGMISTNAASQEDETASGDAAVESSGHPVVKADTLWDLSRHFYGTPWEWKKIYEANTDRIRNPDLIYPGQVFIIPGFEKAVRIIPKGNSAIDENSHGESGVQSVPAPDETRKRAVLGQAPSPVPMPKALVRKEGEAATAHSLSIDFPKGMTGHTVSMPRFKMDPGWKPDGLVLENQGKESMTAAGDIIRVRVDDDAPVKRRSRFLVYRWSSAQEEDVDKKGLFVQLVGTVEIVRKIKDGEFLAVIERSGGTVLVDDVLKRE